MKIYQNLILYLIKAKPKYFLKENYSSFNLSKIFSISAKSPKKRFKSSKGKNF